MGNMHLVTGLAGKKHVTSADQGSFNAAIFGTGNYVLNRGNKFAASIITNNQIRVQDGDLILQGRHARLNEKTYVDLTIENGTVGMYRNDLIVARYTKDAASGIEDINLVVIKGTAVASSPADPEHTEADIINDHVLIADMPLFRVPLNGLNVQNLVPLYAEADLVPDGAVTTAKIANSAVTAAKLATNAKSKGIAVTLAAASWSSKKQTVSVNGVTASNNVLVAAAPASREAWNDAEIYCSAQAAGTLTFTCSTVPTAAVTANVVILV